MSKPAIAFFFIWLASCQGSPEPERPAVYVGALSESDGGLSIALAMQGKAVAAYACGDDPARDQYPGWLIGETSTEGQVHLSAGGWSLQASVGAQSASGTLTGPDGTMLPWSAMRVGAEGLSGLYATDDSGCTTGVIVVDSGRAPIVRGVWCNRDGELRQVIPGEPLGLHDGDLPVEVALATGTRKLEVSPVRLPVP
jgi:hypothetical protein